VFTVVILVVVVFVVIFDGVVEFNDLVKDHYGIIGVVVELIEVFVVVAFVDGAF
jgi:hypothetical protein